MDKISLIQLLLLSSHQIVLEQLYHLNNFAQQNDYFHQIAVCLKTLIFSVRTNFMLMKNLNRLKNACFSELQIIGFFDESNKDYLPICEQIVWEIVILNSVHNGVLGFQLKPILSYLGKKYFIFLYLKIKNVRMGRQKTSILASKMRILKQQIFIMRWSAQSNFKKQQCQLFLQIIKQLPLEQLYAVIGLDSVYIDKNYSIRITHNQATIINLLYVGLTNIYQNLNRSILGFSQFCDTLVCYSLSTLNGNLPKLANRLPILWQQMMNKKLDKQFFLQRFDQVNEEIRGLHIYRQQINSQIEKLTFWLKGVKLMPEQDFIRVCLPAFPSLFKNFFESGIYYSLFQKQIFADLLEGFYLICCSGDLNNQIRQELAYRRYFSNNNFLQVYRFFWQITLQELKYSIFELLAFTLAAARIDPEFSKEAIGIILEENRGEELFLKVTKLSEGESKNIQALLLFYAELFSEKWIYALQGQYLSRGLTEIGNFAACAWKYKEYKNYEFAFIKLASLLAQFEIKKNCQLEHLEAIFTIFFNYSESNLQLAARALAFMDAAFTCNNNTLIDMLLVRRQKWVNLLYSLLGSNFHQGSESLHIACVEVLYLMIRPQFEICAKQLVMCLGAAISYSSLHHFCSFIFERLFDVFPNITSIVPVGMFLQVAKILLDSHTIVRKSYCKRQCQRQFNDLCLVQNVLTQLYKLLDVKVDSQLSILKDIYQKLFQVVRTYSNSILGQEKLKRERLKGWPVGKLIFIIAQKVLIKFKEQKNYDTLRSLFQQRQDILSAIYMTFTKQELQSINIPIFVQYQIQFKIYTTHRKPFRFKRLLPFNLSYRQFKHYFLQFFQNQTNEDLMEKAIAIKIKDFQNHNQIVKESDYINFLSAIKVQNGKYIARIYIENDIHPLNIQQNSNHIIQRTQSFRTTYSTQYSPNHQNSTQYSPNQIRTEVSRKNISPKHSLSINICQKCRKPSPGTRFCANCNRL